MSDEQISMFPGAPEARSDSGNGGSISLTRTIQGKAQEVFDQWLIPVFIAEWMFGAHVDDEEIVELENTVRKGGDFSYVTRRGGKKFSHEGSYQELRIPQRLAFNWRVNKAINKELLIAVDFSEDGARTRLKLTIKLPTTLAQQKESVKTQWAARCDALAARFKSA